MLGVNGPILLGHSWTQVHDQARTLFMRVLIAPLFTFLDSRPDKKEVTKVWASSPLPYCCPGLVMGCMWRDAVLFSTMQGTKLLYSPLPNPPPRTSAIKMSLPPLPPALLSQPSQSSLLKTSHWLSPFIPLWRRYILYCALFYELKLNTGSRDHYS